MANGTIRELTISNRSFRRFDQKKAISRETLEELVDISRYTASGANKQPTRYMVFCSPEENSRVFAALRWAAFYKDWEGPAEGERPAGYIVMLEPEGKAAGWDEGIKGQTMLLAAAEKGIGGCFIANIDKKLLAENIAIPEGYGVTLVIALGYPAEKVNLTEIPAEGDSKYYRDENGTQTVPKIILKDLILN